MKTLVNCENRDCKHNSHGECKLELLNLKQSTFEGDENLICEDINIAN